MMATLSPPKTIITTSNRRRFPSFGQEDFRLMYSESEQKNGWSARSISSFNTDDGAGSTTTEPMSNTVRAREMKQKEKRRFVSFTKVLMKFLEKKNPTVCKNARNVIQKYKSKKRGRHFHGEEDASESMSVSIKAPLKQIVGSTYWTQAKGYLNQMETSENRENVHCNKTYFGNDFEPLSLDDANTGDFNETQVEALSQFANGTNSGVVINSYRRQCKRSCPSNQSQADEERKLRKERFWMVVRVLMRYIEKKDSALYEKARATLKDCEKRNVLKEERFTNLIECVQREMKNIVGARYWKKAEQHVAKQLVKKANEKAYEDALVKEAAFFGSLDDFTPLPENQKEHRIDPRTIEDTFAPPPHNKDDWRDPSIPTNVAIPANGSEEDWTSLSSNGEAADALYEYQDTNSMGALETSRKRRKLWRRPFPHFLNMR